MTPTPPSAPPASTWRARLAWLVAHRKGIAGVISAALMFVAPFIPQAAPVIQLLRTGIDAYQKLDPGPSSSPDSPGSGSSSPAPGCSCSGSQVQSVPHFCRCNGCEWRDYFDADAGCGG